MPKTKSIIEILDALEVTKVGSEYLAPGVRKEEYMKSLRRGEILLNYPGKARIYVSQIDKEKGRFNVLTKNGTPILVDTSARVLIVSKDGVDLEELQRKVGSDYIVSPGKKDLKDSL